MRHDNVVPFDPARRGGLARRGAPDKAGAASGRSIVMECPACASELRLEASWLEGVDEVLCGKCETLTLSGPLRGPTDERGEVACETSPSKRLSV